MAKNEPKFIQLISHQGCVYALDESGDVWRRSVASVETMWRKQVMKREK